MKRNRITIQLVGSQVDGQDLRLEDFIDQLNSVKKALRETEHAITGSPITNVDYKVVDLRHSSPSTIVLEAIPINGNHPEFPPSLVAKRFTSELAIIKKKKELLIQPDLDRLLAYDNIGFRPQSKVEKAVIRFGRQQVTIDRKFKDNLKSIVGPDELAEGSISGSIEALNFHNTNRFSLYPPIGPRRILGTFSPNLRPLVKEAIGSFVTIVGILKYKAWSPYPHGVIAKEIDIHERDDQLPRLSELRGKFAGSTGELNSADFIDQLRNEDW